jgi:hypothetical protein
MRKLFFSPMTKDAAVYGAAKASASPVINLVRHLVGQDFTRGDDGGERTGGEDVDGGEARRVPRTDVLRARLVHHTVGRRAVVVLLNARHETESHSAHDGGRVGAHNLQWR